MANFGRPSGSGTRKGFKRIRNRKNISSQTNVSTLCTSNALVAIVPDHATNSSEMFLEKSTAPPKNFYETEPLFNINQKEPKQKKWEQWVKYFNKRSKLVECNCPNNKSW